MRALWIGGATVAAVATVAFGSFILDGPAVAPAGAGLLAYQNADVVARGTTLYDETCAACHGAALEGEPEWRVRGEDGLMPAPPHDETGHTWHHPDEMLFAITKHGSAEVIGGGYQSAMPGFADTLDDDEILAVLSYIKSTWPAEVIAIHNGINADFAARATE